MAKVVFLDPGHGGKDPGAVSGAVYEKDLNLKAALACREFLKDYDCTVVMSRETDIYVPVVDRYRKAISIGAAVSICMHHNANGGDGGEVWFWFSDSYSKTLASLIAQEYKAIGQNLRTGPGMPDGIKPSSVDGTNFGMCREPTAKGIPAILGEFAFVDNATDRQIVDTDAELVEQGKAYGRAIVKYLCLKLKVPVVTPPIVAPPASKPKYPAGGEVDQLNNPLFLTAYSKTPVKKISGKYYFYDGVVINGRTKLTNTKERCGKKPVWANVTGWVGA